MQYTWSFDAPSGTYKSHAMSKKLYTEAVEDMLLNTSTPYAPWTVVEANDKYHARVRVMRTLVDAIEKRVN